MPTDLPMPVETAWGASRVDFPWTEAQLVIDALEDVRATLGLQLLLRSSKLETISEWTGPKRDEFDEKYAELSATGSDLWERASSRVGDVLDRADNANQQQIWENNRAAEAIAERAQERLIEP
jgi:hypothetical protein